MHDDMVERVAKAIDQVSTSMKPYRTDRDLLEACARAAIETMKSLAPTCQQCGAILPFDYRGVTGDKESPLK